MPRFPTRTLVLMTLSLVAFAWFWWKSHQTVQRDSRVPVMVLMDAGVP